MLAEVSAQPGRVVRDVEIQRLLISSLITNPITVITRSFKARAHEVAGGEQIGNVPAHVRLIRSVEIWANHRCHLISHHEELLADRSRFGRQIIPVEQRVEDERKVLLIEKAMQRVERVRDNMSPPDRRIDNCRLPDDDVLVAHHSG